MLGGSAACILATPPPQSVTTQPCPSPWPTLRTSPFTYGFQGVPPCGPHPMLRLLSSQT